MSDSAADYTKFVPGFDFLQALVKGAGAALPSVGQWVAPTLDPDEIDKRIEELRTVQFWLEQNARMLSATIQALEVQRMTLSTLRTMNVQMGDLRDAMRIRTPAEAEPAAAPAPLWPRPSPPPPAAETAEEEVDEDTEEEAEEEEQEPPRGAAERPAEGLAVAPDVAANEAHAEPAPAAAVDPMQWWSALTQQFTELASAALKESAAARPVPMAVPQTASKTQRKTAAKTASRAAGKSAAKKPAKPRAAAENKSSSARKDPER